jgi:hypothetical protein
VAYKEFGSLLITDCTSVNKTSDVCTCISSVCGHEVAFLYVVFVHHTEGKRMEEKATSFSLQLA